MNAILVERDYKGEYERFALTPEEFEKEFPETVARGAWPVQEADTDTIAPLVHIWFKPCVVGDEAWMSHFTDMEQGLPESDIEAGNLAYVREDFMQSLKVFLPKAPEPPLTPAELNVLSDSIQNIRNELIGSKEPRPDLEKLLHLKEVQLEAAQNGIRVSEDALEGCWAVRDSLFDVVTAQLASKQNLTPYGEPQAHVQLSNNRWMEITEEHECLPEGECFYSAKLFGAEHEGLDILPIYSGATEDMSFNSLKAIILDVLLTNETEPMHIGRGPKTEVSQEGFQHAGEHCFQKIQKAYDALNEALEAVDLAENNGSRLHPSVGNQISTAKIIVSKVIEDLRNDLKSLNSEHLSNNNVNKTRSWDPEPIAVSHSSNVSHYDAEHFIASNDDSSKTRHWLGDLDEIDLDCVLQYEFLLGRQLKDYAEYHEIDQQVDEMILEWENSEEFFKAYPSLIVYKKGDELPELSQVSQQDMDSMSKRAGERLQSASRAAMAHLDEQIQTAETTADFSGKPVQSKEQVIIPQPEGRSLNRLIDSASKRHSSKKSIAPKNTKER